MKIEGDRSVLLTREEHLQLSKDIAELAVAVTGLSLLLADRLTADEMRRPITEGTPSPLELLASSRDALARAIPLMARGKRP